MLPHRAQIIARVIPAAPKRNRHAPPGAIYGEADFATKPAATCGI